MLMSTAATILDSPTNTKIIAFEVFTTNIMYSWHDCVLCMCVSFPCAPQFSILLLLQRA